MLDFGRIHGPPFCFGLLLFQGISSPNLFVLYPCAPDGLVDFFRGKFGLLLVKILVAYFVNYLLKMPVCICFRVYPFSVRQVHVIGDYMPMYQTALAVNLKEHSGLIIRGVPPGNLATYGKPFQAVLWLVRVQFVTVE